MQASATAGSQQNKVQRQSHRGDTFAKVLDGRKQPIRGLWIRNGRYYARLSVEDGSSGLKSVRRVPLVNGEGNAVETRAQAEAELARLRTQRTDDALPVLGLTPTFAHYADTYLATVKASKEKKSSTIAKEETILGLWKTHLGGIRLDKIRPAHVAGMMNKRRAGGMSNRTVKLDIIILRNVLKQARDVDGLIHDLPVPPGINRKLKSEPPRRELFTPDELEQLCTAAMAKKEDGAPVTKNGQQFCDYVRLMAYSGARRNEALALRWADVDFQGGKLTIERQAGGAADTDETTKNKKARTVDFTPALEKHLAEMKTRRDPESQWLFPSPQRGAKDIHSMSFRDSLELARKHAKMRAIGFHDLRHHFVSYCVMSGIDFMTIAKWAGHNDGGILIGKVYGHLAETHTKEQAQRVVFAPQLKAIA
jgi:integrase